MFTMAWPGVCKPDKRQQLIAIQDTMSMQPEMDSGQERFFQNGPLASSRPYGG